VRIQHGRVEHADLRSSSGRRVGAGD